MNKPPLWFIVIAVLALLWNLAGCAAFAMDVSLTPQDIAKLPLNQQELYAARTWWAIAGEGVAVIAGALGCIALLLRRQWAVPLFALSLLGLLVQDCGLFMVAHAGVLIDRTTHILQGCVLLIAAGLMVLAHWATGRGWLR